jgi:hypothetical protein
MSNIAGKAYALNVVTPVTRWRGWVKRLIFIVVRAVPQLLSGLQGLSVIHFARWVIISPAQWPTAKPGEKTRLHYDYTLFCSNFNGTWDQYIDAFSDGIPYMLDLAWYGDFGYPGSIPLEPFQNYIRHNQFQTDYYYNATPGAAQRDIKASLRVWRGVRALARLQPYLDPASFEREYLRLITWVQNDLGSMGPGTIASLPTLAVMAHREGQQYTSRLSGEVANALSDRRAPGG